MFSIHHDLYRLDIAFAIGIVSQYLKDMGVQHWSVIKRSTRYLCGTTTHEVHYGPNTNGDTPMFMYCDSDWAGEVDGCKSTIGYCFLLCEGTISWNSKKKPTVTLSSAEAEYMAFTNATNEIVWLL